MSKVPLHYVDECLTQEAVDNEPWISLDQSTQKGIATYVHATLTQSKLHANYGFE